MGGIETYLRNLLAGLAEVDREDRVVVLAPPAAGPLLEGLPGRFTTRIVDQEALASDLGSKGYGAYLRELIEGEAPDLCHFPFSNMFPRDLALPTVLTMMDVQHEFYPEFFDPGELSRRRERVGPSLEAATAIIAPSRFTARSLEERLGVPGEKIAVIGLSHGPAMCRDPSPEEVERLTRELGLPDPFVYYPAAPWPHKNHVALFEALRILQASTGNTVTAVLGGCRIEGREGWPFRDVEPAPVLLPYLEEEDLPVLYGAASALVYPSLFEGFGIPVVEAFVCGCPVLASRKASIPEVAGNAALLFDPAAPEEIAAALGRVLYEPDLAETLARLGRQRAREFDHRSMARRTLDLYHGVAKRGLSAARTCPSNADRVCSPGAHDRSPTGDEVQP